MQPLTRHAWRANTQAIASENSLQAVERYIQESSYDAPWNAIKYFQETTLAHSGDVIEGKTNTNGATAGSKVSASSK